MGLRARVGRLRGSHQRECCQSPRRTEVAGVEEERPLEALPVARRGLVRWWSRAGARASSGVLYIAGPSRLPSTDKSSELITVVLWMDGRLMSLSIA